jgi:RNA-directed DNA polymerase
VSPAREADGSPPTATALEPEWEARFEPKSYGFRPGRGCHDAIEAIYQVVKGKDPRRQWILDADLQGAFDHIDHDFVLGRLGSFPGRGMIRAWLRAGGWRTVVSPPPRRVRHKVA